MIQRALARPLPYLLGLAFLIRLIRIDTRGLQYDDVFSIFLSARSLPEIVRGTAADTMPPLYYFLLHGWMALGQADWYLRLLSVLLSVLAVALLYHWVLAALGDWRAALAAGLLMAISPFQYYHAQDVRGYALLLCFQLGYLLAFTHIWRGAQTGGKSSRAAWTAFILCALGAMYTHNAAVLALALPDLYLLLRRRWRLLLRVILAQGAAGVLMLPWLVLLPQQIAKVQRAWSLWPPGVVDVLQVPVVWSAGLPLPGWTLYAGALLGIEILALLALEVWNGRRDEQVWMLGLPVLALPVAFFAVSHLVRPVFVPRGFILAATAYLGLAGWAISRGWQRGTGKLLLGGFVLAALIGLPAQAGFASFPRSPFESAGAALSAEVQPDEIVLHDNKLSYFPVRYYQPDLAQVFQPDAPGSGNDTLAEATQAALEIYPLRDLEAEAGDRPGVYFVVFTQAIREYDLMDPAGHPTLKWLDARYRLEGREVFTDLEVYHYVRP
jgi:hypothetical protein